MSTDFQSRDKGSIVTPAPRMRVFRLQLREQIRRGASDYPDMFLLRQANAARLTYSGNSARRRLRGEPR